MKFLNHKVIFFVLLLTIPIALAATTVQTNAVYSPDTTVTITGTCDTSNTAVGLQIAIGVNTVWVEEVTSDQNGIYTATFLPPQKASYILLAACAGDLAAETTFCVGTAEECGVGEEEDQPRIDGGTSSSSGSSGGGGCTPRWSCSEWSACDASYQQSRTCTDQRCGRQPKTETRACQPCESWICTEWSACQNNQQTRTCVDEHDCGTTLLKPVLQKACGQVAPGPPPAGVSGRLPPQLQQPSFWEQYKWYLLTIPAALVLVLLVVFLILHFTKKKHIVYNFSELKEWIKKERAAGTSNDDIRQILAGHTGWSEEEISKAFSELGGGQQPAAQPQTSQ